MRAHLMGAFGYANVVQVVALRFSVLQFVAVCRSRHAFGCVILECVCLCVRESAHSSVRACVCVGVCM